MSQNLKIEGKLAMFDDNFEVYLADTDVSKAIHYNIRYQVYCEEMGYEDKNLLLGFQEKDDWDNQQTAHFIVKIKGQDAWVGAVRVIIKNNQIMLPVEIHCEIDDEKLIPNYNSSIEVSRLCIVKEIRRRGYDGPPPEGSLYDISADANKQDFKSPFDSRRVNSSIIWGLLHAVAVYCKHNNISHWYFMTTLGLAKILNQKGMILEPIGLPCNHKGIRHPFRMNVEQILSIPLWKEGYENGYCLYSEAFENRDKKAA